MYFCVNEFKVGVNDNIFSGSDQQKVYNAGRFGKDLPLHLRVFYRIQIPAVTSTKYGKYG